MKRYSMLLLIIILTISICTCSGNSLQFYNQSCLIKNRDVFNHLEAIGENVQLFYHTGTINQIWEIEVIDTNSKLVYIYNASNSQYLYKNEDDKVLLGQKSNNNDNYKWALEEAGDGYYFIKNIYDDTYLTIDYTTEAIITKAFNGTIAQMWKTEQLEGESYLITNRDVFNHLEAIGENVQLFYHTGTINQIWEIDLIDTNSKLVYIYNASNSQYLYKNDDDAVVLGEKSDNDNYKWFLEEAGDGYYFIKNIYDDTYLTIDYATDTIITNTFTGTIAQMWEMEAY